MPGFQLPITAFIIGSVWGMLWMVLSGLLMMMVGGIIFAPPAGLAALLGGGMAAGLLYLAPQARSLSRQASFAVTMIFVLLLAGRMAPFGLPLSDAIVIQFATLILWAFLTVASVNGCLGNFTHQPVSRYLFEILILRMLKGLGLVLLSVFVALPFYVMVMTSLKSQQSLLANPLDFSINIGAPSSELFRSYIELFTDFHFGTFLVNSAIVSVITVLISLAFAIPGAYAVARLNFPGQAFLSRSILLIYMVPAIILVIPLYAVFSQLGLRNSLVGLMIVYPATTIPVALYMLQGYFRGLPSELEEAGLMDGLSRLQVIWKITLPLAVPALASVSLYVFMIAWNEFLFAFMFLDDLDIFTLSRGVVSLNSSEVPRQHLMAGAVVATLPVLVIFLWFEKYLVSGLTAGSVKG